MIFLKIKVYIIILVTFFVLIFLLGHFGLPENVDKIAYREYTNNELKVSKAIPVFIKGKSDTAVFLVHGYGSSPGAFHEIVEIFKKQGDTVIAPLLPGHGVDEQALHKTRYYHWLDYVEKEYTKHRPLYKNFFVIGISLGGNLILNAIVKNENISQPTGIITIGTPVVLNGWLNRKFCVSSFSLFFTGWIKYFVFEFPRGSSNDSSTQEINPFYGYMGNHILTPIHSLKRGVRTLKKNLRKINAPYLVMHGVKDKVVHIQNAYYLLQNVVSKHKESYIVDLDENMTSNHRLLNHRDVKQNVTEIILSFIDRSKKRL